MQFREVNHIYYYIANGGDIKIIIHCYADSLVLLPHSLYYCIIRLCVYCIYSTCITFICYYFMFHLLFNPRIIY